MRLPGPKPKAYYLVAAAVVLLVVHVKNAETYPTRQDVLVVEAIFLFVMLGGAALLGIHKINPMHGPGWRNHLHLVPLTAMLLVGAYGWSKDWNPAGQLRKPDPWRDWDIPDPHSAAGEAYHFAHAIELPDPYVPDGFYREGLFGVFGRTTRLEYIEHLCAHWAGEFIYRKVRDVEGVAQLRGRDFKAERNYLHERYAWEDPYNYVTRLSTDPYGQFLWGKKFSFFESGLILDERLYAPYSGPHKSPSAASSRELRYHRFLRRPVFKRYPYWRFTLSEIGNNHEWLKHRTAVRVENVERISAKIGYTWRGLRLPADREYGIAGSELIVLDLETGTVLGFRRGFIAAQLSRDARGGLAWEFAFRCPFPFGEPVRSPEHTFIEKLIIPPDKE